MFHVKQKYEKQDLYFLRNRKSRKNTVKINVKFLILNTFFKNNTENQKSKIGKSSVKPRRGRKRISEIKTPDKLSGKQNGKKKVIPVLCCLFVPF